MYNYLTNQSTQTEALASIADSLSAISNLAAIATGCLVAITVSQIYMATSKDSK